MIALLLLACAGEPEGPDPNAPPPAKEIAVKLALNWYPEPEFGGFYEGVLGGHYAAAGFAVEIVPGGPGAPTLELLETGKVQAAISAADDLLLKRSKGIHAVGVWPAFQLNPQGLMVHVSTRIARFEDIPDGSTIAIEVGSPFQTFLWNQQGWEGKVKAVPYGGQVGVFLADPATIQQAYITSEPCIARSQGAEVTFLKAADAGWNPYGSLLALPEPLPAWAPQFVEATHRSWEAYGADPGRGNAEISRLNEQMKPELIGCITDAQRPFVAGTDGMGSMTGERWEAVAATLVEQKLLPPGSTAAGAWKVLR